ncbi:MAG: cobyric acid synthase [Desulfobacteraceae bacterium]
MALKNGSKKKAACLAVLGTGSDVGKSIVTTAICRCLVARGVRVTPYKAQNMSNNSGVTPEGLEMGRAQIVQAEASRIAPHVDMNPILLKPTSEVGAQVVLMGRVEDSRSAREYHHRKGELENEARNALDRLRRGHDVVVMEGAGSCAEVNLMARDLVNLRMAEYADAPVVLVADIHRGGVFAQIVGTLACLPPEQRDRIAGFIINRFRGDLSLFEEGTRWIENRTGKPVFGVLPWYSHFRIEAEDSVVIEAPAKLATHQVKMPAVAVIRIPHISNFTDFDPLDNVHGLGLHFLEAAQDLAAFSAVILPGSKSTRSDLAWLHHTGWTAKIQAFVEAGGHVLGICGGYQMMGRAVHDPTGIEGEAGTSPGLGILPVETELKAPKTTTRTQFSWNGTRGSGYEIHMGRTRRTGGGALFEIHEKNARPFSGEDGCISQESSVMGTYIHGLFDQPEIIRKWLDTAGIKGVEVSGVHGLVARDRDYDLLADHFERHVDMDKLAALL